MSHFAEAKDSRVSLGVRLLADIRTLFGDLDAMHSATIVDQLTTDHERKAPRLDADAPWSELRGKPLTQRGLASLLRRYNVRPTKVRVGNDVLQGYRRPDLHDAWQRYLPSVGIAGPEHPEQSDGIAANIPYVPDVPDVRNPESASNTGCIRCAGEGCPWCFNLIRGLRVPDPSK